MMTLHTGMRHGYAEPLVKHSSNILSLYFFIEAEFKHPEKNFTSNMVVYDQVYTPDMVENRTSINSEMLQSKYPLKDIHNQLKGANVKFTVYMDYMSSYGTSTRVKVR